MTEKRHPFERTTGMYNKPHLFKLGGRWYKTDYKTDSVSQSHQARHVEAMTFVYRSLIGRKQMIWGCAYNIKATEYHRNRAIERRKMQLARRKG